MTDVNGIELRVERLAGRVSVLANRMDSAEQWVGESKEFHVEMSGNWNRFVGAQEATEKLQAQRHQENVDKMAKIQTTSTIWNVVIALIGLVCAACMAYLAVKAANHADVDPAKYFHSDAPQITATSQQISGGFDPLNAQQEGK